MSPRREIAAFALVLGSLVGAFLAESLFGGKVLSPADLLFVAASFRDVKGPDYEPANRLLTDPVLQFQPWLEFNRAMLRRGRLPLWNDRAGCGAPHLANGQSAAFDPFHLIAYFGTLPAAAPAGSPPRGSGSPVWGCSFSRGRGGSAPGGAGSRASRSRFAGGGGGGSVGRPGSSTR